MYYDCNYIKYSRQVYIIICTIHVIDNATLKLYFYLHIQYFTVKKKFKQIKIT